MVSGKNGDGKVLYLLDAMALAYRAHFVFISRPLVNSKGQNTSAAYGFTTALLRLIEEHDIDHIAVVFDVMGAGGTFRDELYEAYKAHRDPPPEELLANLPLIKEIVRAMDIPVIEREGVEADDVIGTLARRAEADGAHVVIVSPDKDFQQLLSEAVSIYRPAHRGESFDPITLESFREKYGLEPHQFIDMLALMGDASDNVPGVPGIGEKTAMKLIQEYGSVENLVEHAAEVSGKRAREGLLAHAEDALLSKRLVTIKTDVDVGIDWEALHRKRPNLARLRALFRELEFNTLLPRVEAMFGEDGKAGTQGDLFDAGEEGHAGRSPAEEEDLAFDFGPYEQVRAHDAGAVDYAVVRDRKALDDLARTLAAQPVLSLDTETTSTEAMYASLVGLSFSWAPGQGRYVPTPMPDGTPTEAVLDALRKPLQQAHKVGQNLKYDLLVLARHGLRIEGPLFDTMVAHYLIAPEDPHGLDALARRYLNYRMIPISDLIGTGKNQLSMRDVPLDVVGPYACEDADVALQLVEILRAQLAEHELTAIAEEMEFPLIYVLADMELTGIRVDPDVLGEISAQLERELAELEAQIYEVAGERFNIGSTQQLGEILFERLGLRVVAKTATGRPSTKERVLEELATEHPLPGLILDWRQLAKLKSTYVDSLAALIHPETGRVHTTFNQTVTATGRLSSSNPNLQNIPVRTERGREIRRAFVPEPGWRLVSADYAQIELRILASLSGDEALIAAFRRGEDIHTATAARVFGVPPGEVTREQRRKAKEVNYGIPYGVSAFGLAQRLRIPVKEAQELINQYQRSFPGVTRYLAEQVEKARRLGYVETKLGRRRYVPDINARNRNVRSAAERIAVNMPMQGTQADMIKLAMVRIHRRLHREGRRSRMLLQVHDELLFEAPPEEVEALCALVREEMTAALPLDVPIEVDIGVGDNWLDAH
ncbi:DNA polymerase I [Rhodocaloribacter litoris]|uniref:DNA polymerase I n=1 Tax=Rhodocaloribacter litoris TaxID=2558931 RepID=UPI00142078E0|nr:DNA polymerase I [Rhodocaloribacter litoris]QXD14849.1 DNA polymerase I [Rhodocaloribacter litoris]